MSNNVLGEAHGIPVEGGPNEPRTIQAPVSLDRGLNHNAVLKPGLPHGVESNQFGT